MTAEEDRDDDDDDDDDNFIVVVVVVLPSGRSPARALSVVDHFKRVDEDEEEEEEEEDQRRKRVVSVLLGSVTNGRLDVTSSCGAFEEDPADALVWFLDHAYAEQMYRMHSNPAKKSQVVLDGTKDQRTISISENCSKVLRRSGVSDCELVAGPGDGRRAYRAVLDVKDGTMTQKNKNVQHVSCTIEASDPEAIGRNIC